MAITLAEIQQGVSEFPELKNEILAAFEPDATDYLKGKGFELLTADQKAQLLKKHESEVIGPRVKEFATGIEKDVFDITGMKKLHDEEKYYDYLKRGLETQKAQISDLQKAGVTDEATKQRIAALEQELAEAKSSVENGKKEYETEKLNLKLANNFANAFGELKIAVPSGVAEKDAADYQANKRRMLQQDLLSQYEPVEQDGKIVYKGKDGQFAMNGGNYYTEKELLTKAFQYEFELAPNRTGTGSGHASGDASLAAVSDKQGLYAAASKKGLVAGSPEWKKFIEEGAASKNIAL